MRDKILAAMKAAMKSKNEVELSTLRLMIAAIKAQDIDHRANTGNDEGISDEQINGVLATMVKQRKESAESYKKAKRKDLADRELTEIEIITAYLPKQLTKEEVEAAITDAVAESHAESLKDMGKVMAILKEKYTGQLDFGKASACIKKRLSA